MRHAHVGHAGQRSGRRTTARSAALALVSCALLALVPAAAHANVVLSAQPTLPSTASIGSTGVSGSIELTNSNTGADVSSTVCNFGDGGSCTGAPGTRARRTAVG